MPAPRPLFHIVDEQGWTLARADGQLRPPSLLDEGFVHCSFAEQVPGTLARHFDGVAGLLVLEIDPAVLTAPIRLEDGGGDTFPHVYGPIPVAAVTGEQPAATFTPPGPAGDRRNPGVASADR
ncbi:MAG TPA: DUF952 domain-containing protein [Jatrophihabitantaceae bacterium]|jgi:uncharacterized protein (DUF952 family)